MLSKDWSKEALDPMLAEIEGYYRTLLPETDFQSVEEGAVVITEIATGALMGAELFQRLANARRSSGHEQIVTAIQTYSPRVAWVVHNLLLWVLQRMDDLTYLASEEETVALEMVRGYLEQARLSCRDFYLQRQAVRQLASYTNMRLALVVLEAQAIALRSSASSVLDIMATLRAQLEE